VVLDLILRSGLVRQFLLMTLQLSLFAFQDFIFGSRQPSELELDLAFHQGKYFAGISKKLKGTA
ncbi:putative nad(p)h dehydrogenase (quinone) fqr1-like 1, partial [Quercus suber]